MSGGLIQLVSVGFENLYLTADPEITFFKMVYKRHTNFSQEPVTQLFSTTPDFGERVSCSLAKTADLISNIYLYVQLPELPKLFTDTFHKFKWCKKIGYALINYIELEINGQMIDKLYGDWLNIWSSLTSGFHNDTEDILVGNVQSLTKSSNGKTSYNLYIPINFFFNKNKGLALPVIALHLSDVKIHVQFNELKEILVQSPTHYINIEEYVCMFSDGDILTQNVNGNDVNIIFNYYDYETRRLYYTKYYDVIQYYTNDSLENKSKYKLYDENFNYVIPSSNEVVYTFVYPNISINESNLLVNFIYLDNLERKRFATSNHEYLITTLEYSGERTIYNTHTKIKLGFVNPSKELFWVAQLDKIKNGFIKEKFNYTSNINYSGSNLVLKSQIFQNGQIRSFDHDKYFYNYLKSYLYHMNEIEEGINLYSYSIDPIDYQPKGSCNFSRIDDLVLELTLSSLVTYDNPLLLRVYNNNYNVLRITNGLAGLTFIN